MPVPNAWLVGTLAFTKFSLSCPIGHRVDISREKWTSNLRSHSSQRLPRHIRKPRQVQLVRHGDIRGGAVAVLAEDDVGLATARVLPVEGVRAVQQHDHIGILLEAVMQAN